MQHEKPGLVPGFLFAALATGPIHVPRAVSRWDRPLPVASAPPHPCYGAFAIACRSADAYTRFPPSKRKFAMRLAVVLMLMATTPVAAFTCDQSAIHSPLPIRTTLVAPFAPELQGAPLTQGASSGLLAGRRDESLAIDTVLLRLRTDACLAQAGASSDSYAGYAKKTEFDNTPWRFEGKPGQRFSAEEFDAWMKSRGVRVAKGRAVDPAAEASGKVSE